MFYMGKKIHFCGRSTAVDSICGSDLNMKGKIIKLYVNKFRDELVYIIRIFFVTIKKQHIAPVRLLKTLSQCKAWWLQLFQLPVGYTTYRHLW